MAKIFDKVAQDYNKGTYQQQAEKTMAENDIELAAGPKIPDRTEKQQSPQHVEEQQDKKPKNMFDKVASMTSEELSEKYEDISEGSLISGGKQFVRSSGSSFFGTPGDVLSLLGLQPSERKTELPSQREKWKQEAKMSDKELIENASDSDELIPQYLRLPTSDELRNAYTEYFNIGEPKTETERYVDKIASALGSTASTLPISPIGAIAGSTARGAAMTGAGSVLGAASGQKIREMGGPEWAAIGADIGTNFATGTVKALINNGGARRLYRDFYRAAEQAMNPNITGDARRLAAQMRAVIQRMRSGSFTTPATTEVANQAERLLNDITANGGRYSYRQALDAKRKLNDLAKDLYSMGASGRGARAFYDDMREDLIDFLSQTQNTHPEFYNSFRAGDEVFGTLAASNRVTDWLTGLFSSKIDMKKVAQGAAGGLALAASTGQIAPIFGSVAAYAPGAAAGLSALESAKFIYKFMASPVLRRHYLGLIGAALSDSKGVAIKELKAIDQGISDNKDLMKMINKKIDERNEKKIRKD